MANNKGGLHCRVCGLLQSEPPWGEDGKDPSYEICDCCGVEFGYEDATPAGVVRARKKWRESGYRWVESSARPEGWDPAEQLQYAWHVDGLEAE